MDAMIGTWKGDGTSYTGMKELLDTFGAGATFERYTKKFTTVVSKEGNNKYIFTTSVEGEPDNKETLIIGQKCMQSMPGVPDFEIDYWEEGGKIFGKFAINGVEMTGCRYIEGNTLILESKSGGVNATWKSTRA